MINKGNWLATLTMVLLFGMTVVGHLDAQTDSRLNGIWFFSSERTEIEITFQNGNYEQSSVNMSVGYQEFTRGTYAANNGILTLRPTHTMMIGSMAIELGLESAKWYTMNELRIVMVNFLTRLGLPQDSINELIEASNSPPPRSYSVVSSSLIMTINGESAVFTKK
jgi:hypothetical protein